MMLTNECRQSFFLFPFPLKLMHKLSVEAPPKILVERYLIEIAKNYNVPYEPDAMVRVRTSYFLFCSLLFYSFGLGLL